VADIFISYSKTDRDLAVKLSAFLEAEGWTVWWDNSLHVADLYRDVIMKELMAARAVICIWTERSVKSDWVRAEAGRAKAEGKLIPVKTSGLTYADIPLPFGEMHTEDLAATDLIQAAIVAQLSKPIREPSTLWMASRTLRSQVFTWTGIVGGSLTLFTSLKSLISLADWARWIVEHWHDWTHAFWTTLFGWIGVRIHPVFIPLISFLLFSALLLAGTILRLGAIGNLQLKMKWFLKAALIYGAWLLAFALLRLNQHALGLTGDDRLWLMIPLALFTSFGPYLALILSVRERLQCTILVLFVFLFWFLLAQVPEFTLSFYDEKMSSVELYLYAALSLGGVGPFGALILVSFAPLAVINKRLMFLALGVLILFGLNEVSLLGVQRFLEPPPN
jgi:hypothetical protein